MKRAFETFGEARREEGRERNPAYYAKTARPFKQGEAHFTDSEYRTYRVTQNPALAGTNETDLTYHAGRGATVLGGDAVGQPLLLMPTDRAQGLGIPVLRVRVERLGFVAGRGRTGTVTVSGLSHQLADMLINGLLRQATIAPPAVPTASGEDSGGEDDAMMDE